MKLQFVSDLHLEFEKNRKFLRENPLQPRGDILILAGDIIPDKHKKKARPFYELWQKQFELVISIKGNHEFYGGLAHYAYPAYQSNLAPNHIILNNNSLEYQGARFLAGTLWSWIPPKQFATVIKHMNDYHLIYSHKEYGERINLTPADTNNFHRLSLQFLEQKLAIPFAGPTIVLTHHLPTPECVHPRFKSYEAGSAYASDLGELITRHTIDLWIFGHQHESMNFIDRNTRFLSNPLGYLDEDRDTAFRTDLAVEI